MERVYHTETVIGKVWSYFIHFFKEATQPTFQHLFDLVVSVLALNGYQSVRFNFGHFIEEDSAYRLNSYYYALNESKISLEDWIREMVRFALELLPADRRQPLVLSIDDTMVEKYGGHFEHRSRLYDHARHNGSRYLNGHCFVSLLLSIPVRDGGDCRYLHIPVAYRMWTKETSKLELAAGLVRSCMEAIGPQWPTFLCCDSWYPKDAVLLLPSQFPNLEMACSVRSDTVLYDLPPARTGKRGRPRIYGRRLSLDDFSLKEVPGSGYRAGCRRVLTNLWGRQEVFAVVTQPLSGGARRLFLCTQLPQDSAFGLEYLPESDRVFPEADPMLLPLAVYSIRRHIEVSYYEQKTFWSLRGYMLRSRAGMERLINLLTLVYSSMTLLPYWDRAFSSFKTCSPQQTRFLLGDLIRKERFLTVFASRPELQNNDPHLANALRKLAFCLLSAA